MSVRSRLEAKPEQPEEISVPVRGRTTLVVGNAPTLSTRERAERQETDAAADPIVRTQTQARGLTESANYNGNLRSRLEHAEDVRREQEYPESESRQELSASVNAIMDQNIAAHNRELAREAAEEAALIKAGKLIRL